MHRHRHSHGHGHGHRHADTPNEETAVKFSSSIRLVRLAKPEALLLLLGLISLLVSAGVNLAMPYAMGRIFDSNKKSDAIYVVSILSGVFAAGALFTFIRGFIFAFAGERLVARLRRNLFGQIVIQDVGFFDKNKTGELVNRLSADTTIIQLAATVTISNVLKFLLQVVGGTLALFVLSWKLTLVMLIPIPLLGLFGWLYGRFVRNLGRRIQEALAQCTAVAEEAIGGMRYVRSFGNEEIEKARYGEHVGKSFKLGKLGALASGLYQSGAELAAYISIILVILYGTVLFLNNEITQGAFLSFILYAIYVSHALGALSGQVGEFMRSSGASDRVFELLDKEPEMNISGGKQLKDLKGEIKFENVDFAYPSRSDIPILKNFSLKLTPNTMVALVGPSGGGKTTVAQLILRLYDPNDGKILLDEIPLVDIDPKWLREQIGFVSQDPILFNSSIKENISYGRTTATQEEIENAARAAHIHEYIQSLPEGYEAVVGERGVKLSGGQKQRIAIARAILKEPRILLLDEATSALDAENEHLVQLALEQLMKDRTVLVIAHRLSTVQNANMIAVISDGKIIQQGTHQELIKDEEGTYFKLANNQLQKAESDAKDAIHLQVDNEDNSTKKKKKQKKDKKQNGTEVNRKASEAGLLQNE